MERAFEGNPTTGRGRVEDSRLAVLEVSNLPADPGGHRSRAEHDDRFPAADRSAHVDHTGAERIDPESEQRSHKRAPIRGGAQMLRDQERGKYMPKAVAVKKSTTAWESPPVKPLDEAVWQAWKAKGRAQDREGRETRIKALKWGSIVALLAVAAWWSELTSYEIVIRCVLVAATVGMTFEAFHKRQYALGTVFGGLALIYNPIAPVFSFSGDWQRALVVLSAVPFIASLTRRDLKEARID
jgi:hypothetical protein